MNARKLRAYLVQNGWSLASVLLVVFYIFLRFPFFAVDAFVPDETWHTSYMSQAEISLNQINYQGFGAVYWILGIVIFKFFSGVQGMFVLRYLCFISYLFATYFIFLFSAPLARSSRFLILLCWLSIPMSWWAHKIIMPELMILGLLSFTAYLFFKNQERSSNIAWLLLGFCFGIKFNNAPCVAFLGILFFSYNDFSLKKIYRQLPVIFLMFCFGFILSNPFLLIRPQTFFDEITANGNYFPELDFYTIYYSLKQILFNSKPSWDMVFFAGLDKAVIPVLSLIFLLYLILRNPTYRTAYLSALTVFIAMLFLNMRWVCYYSFPFIMILFWCLAATRPQLFEGNERNRKTFNLIIFLAFLVNIFYSYPNYKRDRYVSQLFAENLSLWKQNIECAKPFFASRPVDFIVDNSDAGQSSKRIGMLDFQYLRNDIKWIDDKMKNNSLRFVHVFEAEDVVEEMLKSKQKQIIIITGNRMRILSKYDELPDSVIKILQRKFDVEVVRNNECKNMEFLFIKINPKKR